MDARWLGIGGPGRTTELLLRGLAELSPPGRWMLWGGSRVEGVAWDAAKIVGNSRDPRVLLGQRALFEVPRADLVLFMHQQRPLASPPAVTLVYDTIALRYGASPAVRAVKRRFLRRIASTSRAVLTISEHSKASIVKDLRVAPDRVDIVRFPFDTTTADRVLSLRGKLAQVDIGLYVGNFLPHKNLPRLLEAFCATAFQRDGGRLVLAGGTPAQANALQGQMSPQQRACVTVRSECPQHELDRLYATSRFLVQPSLEEGFGLPAWEALCCGLPVVVSDGGALPEVTRGFATPFPARSTEAMSSAIDECAARGPTGVAEAFRTSTLLRAQAPTTRQFAEQFLAVLQRHTSYGPSL